MPKVTIDYTSNLDKFYISIKSALDARYHQPGLTIDGKMGNNPKNPGVADYHASDGVIVNGSYASTDGGATWVHIERLVK